MNSAVKATYIKAIDIDKANVKYTNIDIDEAGVNALFVKHFEDVGRNADKSIAFGFAFTIEIILGMGLVNEYVSHTAGWVFLFIALSISESIVKRYWRKQAVIFMQQYASHKVGQKILFSFKDKK